MSTQEKSTIMKHNSIKCLSGCALFLIALSFIISNDSIYSSIESALSSFIFEGFDFWKFVWSIVQIPLTATTYIIAPVLYFFLILSIKTYYLSNIGLFAIVYCLYKSHKKQQFLRLDAVKKSEANEFQKIGQFFGVRESVLFFRLKARHEIMITFISIFIILMSIPIGFVPFSSDYPDNGNFLTIMGASHDIYGVMSEFFNTGYHYNGKYFWIHLSLTCFSLFFCATLGLFSLKLKSDKNYIIQIEGKKMHEIESQIKLNIDKY